MTAAFRLLARLRGGDRAVHATGRVFTGELTAEPGNDLPLPARTPVTVRLSKGIGTPRGWPDVLGLAITIPDRWDILLSSSGTGRRTRLLPWPARRWSRARYGSLLPYRHNGSLVWLMASPDGADPPRRFTILASRHAEWRPVARLTVGSPVTDHPTFDPMLNHPPGIELAPRWIARLREAAYAGSRRGRNQFVATSSHR